MFDQLNKQKVVLIERINLILKISILLEQLNKQKILLLENPKLIFKNMNRSHLVIFRCTPLPYRRNY